MTIQSFDVLLTLEVDVEANINTPIVLSQKPRRLFNYSVYPPVSPSSWKARNYKPAVKGYLGL
jgi:hypothetical protein